jgi:DNA-binding CsgD family transcriptional regulator
MPLMTTVEGKASWIKYIEYRITKNKNFISGTYGPTGSGKSWTDLSIAEMLNPDFKEHPERICFTPLSVMEAINQGKVHRGDVIIMEELGIQAGNRDWQSMFNKVIVQLLQTFRNLGIILLVNVPYEDFIDVGVRKLMHASWRTMEIDYATGIIKIKPQVVQYNDRKGKFYYKYLRVIKDKKVKAIRKWNVPAPSKELTIAYEKMKDRFTKELNKNLEKKLKAAEDMEKAELTQPQEEVYEMLMQDLSIHDIAIKLGTSMRNIYYHIGFIKKKGFIIPKRGENA